MGTIWKPGLALAFVWTMVFSNSLRESRSAGLSQDLGYQALVDYPDSQWIHPVYGTLSYIATAGGEVKRDSTDFATTYSCNINAKSQLTYDRNGMANLIELNGEMDIVTVYKNIGPDDPCQERESTQKITFSGGNTKRYGPNDSNGTFGINASKQKHLAHLENGGVENTEEFDLKYHSISKARCQTPTTEDGVSGFAFRVPLHSSETTPFAVEAARIEGAGTYKGRPLTNGADGVDGMIESAFDGRGMHGEYTTPMLATVSTTGVNWNTEAAFRAMGMTRESNSGQILFPGSLQVKWQLGDQSPPQDLKLTVDVDDYDNWIPTGGADEKKAGNDIAVRATLTTKDGKKPQQSPSKIIFELEGTSSEPGVCLNWPSQNATTDPDLKFDQANNPHLVVSDPRGQRAVSDSGDTAVGAYVNSYDWGAYGTLKVTAEMPDGKIVDGHFKNDSGPSNILLPKRTGDSKIADKWKADHKVSDKPDNDDSEKQDGNHNEGDGFTLYEEYRGMMARGQHKYLNPHKKDLIVENQVGAAAQGALQLFQSQSGINVIELNQGELPENRLANVNHGYAHGGDQYGLRLKPHVFEDPSTRGEAQPPGGTIHSPKGCTEIWISTVGGVAQAVVNSEIAHEIAHGCGVKHHGDRDVEFPDRDVTDPPWQIYNTAGDRISPDSLTPKNRIEGPVGAKNGKASGNIDCIMVYNHNFQWSMPLGTGSKVYMAAPTEDRPGTIFCRSREGTGWNAKTHKPFPVFGDAERGDCMSQFQLKDW